jgi:TusA-related sulfurtransferase
VKTIDNRGLEPPQPMMRTLKNLEKMEKGEKLTIINDRRPMFLYEELDEQGYLHETEAQDDGSYKIIIIKTGDPR